MSPQQIKIGKIVVLATWLFGAACFFFPLYGASIGGLGRALFYILFCVHLIEFFVFMKLYRSTGEPLSGHFFKTMAYGVLHQNEVRQQLGES